MVETHAAHCKMKSDVQSYNSYLSTVSRCRVRHLAIARGRRAGPGCKDRSRLRPSSNENSASGGPLRDGKDGGMDGETGLPALALYAPSRFAHHHQLYQKQRGPQRKRQQQQEQQ